MGEIRTGCLLEAAVEGLRSWVGDGARLMEAVWIVSAIWIGMEEAMLLFNVEKQVGLTERRRGLGNDH